MKDSLRLCGVLAPFPFFPTRQPFIERITSRKTGDRFRYRTTKEKSFFETIPGALTAVAGLITAVVGLIKILKPKKEK